MKSEKTGKVAIQFKNNMHNQEIKPKRKPKKIQNKKHESYKGRFKTKHRGHLNKLFKLKLQRTSDNLQDKSEKFHRVV